MADKLPLDVAMLVGLIMQTFLYGVYQVLFFGCLYVLVYVRGAERINWGMLVTTLVMWVLISMNFGLSWSRIMDAFIGLQPALREDPLAIVKYFGDLGHWKEVARTAAYLGLTACADCLLIYRCYIVWSRNKYIIILPILLLCCSITSAIGIEVLLGTAGSRTDVFATGLAAWATTFFSVSLVQNLVTTFLIVYRIWRVNINISSMDRTNSLWPVMAIIMESGAIYSSTVLVLLATYASGSFSQFIALDILVPTTGIVFNLIIVRVGLGLSQNSGGRHPSSTLEPPSSVRFRTLKKLNISVSRQVSVDRDISSSRMPTRDRDIQDDVSDHLDNGYKPSTIVV